MSEKGDIIKDTVGQSEAWSTVARGYDDMIRAFSAFHDYAATFGNLKSSDVVLDLACGSGGLTRIIHSKVSKVYCYDFAHKMIHIINCQVDADGIKNVFPTVGDGENLIYKDRFFDKIFSIYGLKFFPDRIKGLLEAFRVLKPGGRLILGIWAPVEELEMFNVLLDAMNKTLPQIEKPEHVSSMDSEDIMNSELTGVGFKDVVIEKKTFTVAFDTIETMFDGFVKGAPPFASIKQSMEADQWVDVRKKVLQHTEDTLGLFDKPNVSMTSFYVSGEKPHDNF